MDIQVKKRSGDVVNYDAIKIKSALKKCLKRCHIRYTNELYQNIEAAIKETNRKIISVEDVQNIIEKELMKIYPEAAKEYILYRKKKEQIREWVDVKEQFIRKYKDSYNTADATIDANSNVSSKNIGILNTEIHKEDNIQISRRMVANKLKEIFPDFDHKQYERDLENHIIYKHDENSFSLPAPYCVAMTMYPFLHNGIKDIGGLSAKPKNLDSYCGMLVNMIFATSAQFLGACAVPEALLYFDYFARKEWGNDYYLHTKDIINPRSTHPRTIQEQIHQHFQQVVYSINQPAAARGMQSAFVNFSYYDKNFFESMFGDFVFPDDTKPIWESLCWLQKDFMQWFNEERLKCILTFPVETFAMVYKDGEFLDQDSADFVAEEYARGHSFFTYISDTVDALASCCRLRNALEKKEFSFTNGNISIQSGSKSVITINLSRITQDWYNQKTYNNIDIDDLCKYLENILERVYKYHTAYNELLWDMKDAHLLPVYDAGFINLNKQFLTIGINGLNQAAEFLGIKCNDNPQYMEFCQKIFGYIAELNKKHDGNFNGHNIKLNTELVPGENLGCRFRNWDKEDGYWVPEDTNLYASYIFKPNDPNTSVLEKLRMHGRNYIGDYLDGGSAAHINLEEHLSKEQYEHIIKYAADNGVNYFTFNIPMTECCDCHHIINAPVNECPECHSHNIKYWVRIIGYLTAVPSWSKERREEFKSRVFHSIDSDKFSRFTQQPIQ